MPLEDLEAAGVVGRSGLANLASRNLSRGRTYQLPSDQDRARVILAQLEADAVLQSVYRLEGAAEATVPGAVEDFVLGADERTRGTLGLNETPLWYYVLQEADEFGFSFAGTVAGLPDTLVRVPEDEAGGGVRTGATLGPSARPLWARRCSG